jgi:magnesium transporter
VDREPDSKLLRLGGPREEEAGPPSGPDLFEPSVLTPGTAAGIEPHELSALPSTPVPVTVIDYCPDRAERREMTSLQELLAHRRPDWCAVRWINVDGLTDMAVIRALAEKYELHPLAIEDLLHVPQRPKLEEFPATGTAHARLSVIVRMLQLQDEQGRSADRAEEGRAYHVRSEQITIFLGRTTVLTFQEKAGGDVWNPVRQRILTEGSRIRANDASFLLYSLLDAIVDECFPILEFYSDRLEDLEDEVLTRPSQATIGQIHQIKRELLLVRRALWPVREVIGSLSREPHVNLSETTRTFFRDVHDHAIQSIDMVETYREFAAGLTETYMSAMSNRMNEIMKVLTIITTIFVPLTFLAGVYGMNFEYLPEKDWTWGYPAFWVVCIATAVAMGVWFKRRRWV